MIVGRYDWEEADLDAKLAAREGQTLRVYSQEMLLAAMATANDPFESAGESALRAFAVVHEALTCLMRSSLMWPRTDVGYQGGEFDPAEWVGPGTESPLHKLDYNVGRTSPLRKLCTGPRQSQRFDQKRDYGTIRASIRAPKAA